MNLVPRSALMSYSAVKEMPFALFETVAVSMVLVALSYGSAATSAFVKPLCAKRPFGSSSIKVVNGRVPPSPSFASAVNTKRKSSLALYFTERRPWNSWFSPTSYSAFGKLMNSPKPPRRLKPMLKLNAKSSVTAWLVKMLPFKRPRVPTSALTLVTAA